MSAGTNIYTGISPNGTYAFWAGAGVAGGYSTDITKDAKFSVTTSGNVIARNIKILGGEMQVGSKFTVNTDGKVSATDVVLTGEITAEKGTIKGNLNILQAGSLIARPLDSAPASSNRVTLSATGIFAYDASGTETTQISSNATSGGITFTTDAAKIGGWVVSPTTISSTGITLTSGSTPGATSIIASNAGGYVGIKPKSSVGSEIVLWAGTTSAPGPNDGSGSPRSGFQVNADGQLYATGAIISGRFEVQSGSSLGGLLNDTSKVYAQNDEPTGGTYKTGDAWVDTNDSNKLYIYNSAVVAPASKWVLAQDSASARAVADAKRIIVSATQLLSPLRPNFTPSNGVSFTSGDAWYNTSDGNKLYIYNGSAWILTQDSGVADGISAKASLKARLNDGVNLELLKSLIVNTDGAHIYSSFSDINNVTKTKDTYDQDAIPGFFIGWHKPGGQSKIWPAINIGTGSSYLKFSSYTGALEVKGSITATTGTFEGNVTAGGVTIGPSGISHAKFNLNNDGTANFSGTLQAGTLISDSTITAGIIQTSSSSSDRRIVIDSTFSKDTIFFKGISGDGVTGDGKIAVGFGLTANYDIPSPYGGVFSNSFPSLTVSAPTVATSGAFAYPARIIMSNSSAGGIMEINATWTRMKGYVELLNGFDYGTQAVRMISAGTSAPDGSMGKEGSLYFQIG